VCGANRPEAIAKESIVRNISRRNRIIGAGVTLIVLGVVGLVYAAWTVTSNNASGYAQAGQSQALTTDSTVGTISAKLYPGGPSGDVKVHINNPNSFPVTVTDYTYDNTRSITVTGGGPGCTGSPDTTGVSFTNVSGRTDSVPANGNATVLLANKASMSNSSDNDCQNATFGIPLTLSAHSG